MGKYVFDTSALLTYIENEPGADQIEKLLIEAIDKDLPIFVSIVSLIEVYYISLKEQSEKIADQRIELLKSLPFHFQNIGQANVKGIGKVKAGNKMSFADACIASLSIKKKAELVHKDPEFENIINLKQLRLPYKKSKS
jgi:predicted nucleic acid-binding protein